MHSLATFLSATSRLLARIRKELWEPQSGQNANTPYIAYRNTHRSHTTTVSRSHLPLSLLNGEPECHKERITVAISL